MTWERWCCPSFSCTAETWMVRLDPDLRDVWWVAAQEDDHPFMVAATVPVCPRCGATLLSEAEREADRSEHATSEVGPVFDFLRSLTKQTC